MSSSESDDEAPMGTLTAVSCEPRGVPKWFSPLDVRFSQWKVRHTFMDGRALAETAPLVKAVRCTPSEAAICGAPWKVVAPFPGIEVVYWKCKLRDKKTGRPKTDPATGGPLYDSETRLFTLDNRRLYCMQAAAVSVWPERCVALVSEVPSSPPERMRELRKFRTVDSGDSIMIGSTLDKVPFARWCWRSEVGLKSQKGPGSAAPVGVPAAVVPPAPAGYAAAAPKTMSQAGAAANNANNAGAFLLKLVQEGPQSADGAAKGAQLLGMLKGVSEPMPEPMPGKVLLSQLQGKGGGAPGIFAPPPAAKGAPGQAGGKGAALLEQLQPWDAPVVASPSWKGDWHGKGGASWKGGSWWAGKAW